MKDLSALLAISAARHSHLCPRQVLGARAGLVGASLLGFDTPVTGKRLLVILETDGCFADGIEVATGVAVGHRTMRVEDYGKIAATFIDTSSGTAIRIAPHREVRERAWDNAPGEQRRYFAQLHAYQVMPLDQLFTIQEVQLSTPVQTIISLPGIRTRCERCGEEIFNGRELTQDDLTLCKSCAGITYYQFIQTIEPYANHPTGPQAETPLPGNLPSR